MIRRRNTLTVTNRPVIVGPALATTEARTPTQSLDWVNSEPPVSNGTEIGPRNTVSGPVNTAESTRTTELENTFAGVLSKNISSLTLPPPAALSTVEAYRRETESTVEFPSPPGRSK